MEQKDVARKVAQLGFKVFDESVEGQFEHYVYFKDNIEFLSFSFPIGSTLSAKFVQFQEFVDSETSIEQVLENHRKKYLKMVGIVFEEEKGGMFNEHQGSYIYDNESYFGRVDVYDYIEKEGVYSISYMLTKIK
ncbi:hypothetical protein ACIQ1H_05310 [Lysinibacillus sp. NPDC097279]|uniref:hypothetical protein n=1 Tax=Lysinibacillus sp. NPDC097279 TaxID=3364143 RepID=UPI003816F690